MHIPENVDIFHTESSTSWIDENGFLCSITHASDDLKKVKSRKNIEELKSHLKGQKICSIVLVSHLRTLNKEIRSYLRPELGSVYKAIAIVTTNPWGSMFNNKLFSKPSQDYPMRVFTNEIEAKSWLEEYR